MELSEIAIGVFFAVLSSMVLGAFAGVLGSFIGFMLVTGIISYYFIDDIIKGTIYGLSVGIFAGIVSSIIMITFEFILGGKMDVSFMSFGLGGIIVGIMVDGIICMVGGAIGSILNF